MEGTVFEPEREYPLTATNRDNEDSLAINASVSVEDVDVTLLIASSRNGYKFDAWWGENNHVCTHITFGEQDSEYKADNEHSRDASISIDNNDQRLKITDPDPRAQEVGYEPATLVITFTGNAFLATLEWKDEMGNVRETKGGVPLIDPRDKRAEFYNWLEENHDDYQQEE